jgi:hypothetical protein
MAEGLEKPGEIQKSVRRMFDLDSQATDLQRPPSSGEEGFGWRDLATSSLANRWFPPTFASDVREIRGLINKLGGGDEAKELIGQFTGLIGRYDTA